MHLRAFPLSYARRLHFSTKPSEWPNDCPRRSHVRIVDPKSVQWFPGHMRKGMNLVNAKMSGVDVIVEVHDARLPFSGRSAFVQKFGLIRPHILLLNKIDLAEHIPNKQTYRSKMVEFSRLKNQIPSEILFTQLNSPERQKILLRCLIKSLPELAKNSYATIGTTTDHCQNLTFSSNTVVTAIAVGIPNSGKSTLINALRVIGHGGPGGAARVGRNAGQTRSVTQPVTIYRTNVSRLSGDVDMDDQTGPNNFRIQMLDTPGILEPRARSLCEQLSLCVCGAVDWEAVNKEILVDYLLFWWNYRGKLDYVSVLNLPGPTDNVVELLARVCALQRFFIHTNSTNQTWRRSWQPNTIESLDSEEYTTHYKPIPDMNRATLYILQLFNKGAFGRATFYPEDEEAASNYFISSN